MVSTWMSGRSVRAQGLTLAAAGAVAFSGKAIVAKLMYRMGADPVTTVGLRMAMAFPLFAWMAWWSERR
jgi:drug/metabolite transporter (DMT)-like permease